MKDEYYKEFKTIRNTFVWNCDVQTLCEHKTVARLYIVGFDYYMFGSQMVCDCPAVLLGIFVEFSRRRTLHLYYGSAFHKSAFYIESVHGMTMLGKIIINIY